MSITTYAELKAAIATTLNRTDLTADIPTFISIMEAQTETQLRTRQMLATNAAFVIDSELEALPADFLETRSFYLNSNPVTPLTFRTLDSMGQFKQANSGTGKPTEYSVIGTNFQFLKTPDTAYTGTLIYYQSIPRLSDSQTTNWLLTARPDIYLYGALLNSAPYLKDDARIPVWVQFYQNAIDAYNIADERAVTASNGLKAKARQF